MTETRTCAVCGGEVTRRDAQFCSYPCSVVVRRSTIPTEKACVSCGVTMTRREREAAKDWRNRETCSTQCRYAYISRRISEVQPAFIPPPKNCEVCGKSFHKRREESYTTFKAKKACSVTCAAALVSRARSVDWQPRVCTNCGASFSIRGGEKGKYFSKRKCCSPECQFDQMIRVRLKGNPSQHPYPRAWNRALKDQVRQRDGYACQECGVVENGRAHHVHHIDYVKENLIPSNLITLCHSCHGRTCNRANKAYFITRYQAIMAEREREKAA
jgi:hypothetical protein